MPDTTAIERLAKKFTPKHYDIYLDLDIKNLSFSGQVGLSGLADKGSKHLKLHSKDLSVSIVKLGAKVLDFKLDGDILNISLPDNLPKQFSIEIQYSGLITKAMHGIYPSKSAKGKTIISTQFESHHAREAFPCIDEPEAKATFNMTISAPEGLKILGNMPIKNKHKSGDKQVVQFTTSPKMSTYLLAFAVGEMHGVSSKTNRGIEVTAWCSIDHGKDNLKFASETAAKTLDFLEDYFGVEYPLPKLDQVAIPDFSSGAMENWGLVTYREIAMLIDPKKASTATKEMVALVIAHELSHQWFGNLVTMRWWDDLWLNESFATLMEYIVIDNLYPEWNVMLSFTSHEALSAFRRDILPGVQAVATTVNHPDEISTLFDPSIVYAKGARLLWMAYNLVGENNFKKGLSNYFSKHAYDNTSGNDLWDALSLASGQDIKSVMHAWLSRPGLPYLNIESSGDNLSLKQRHLTSGGAKSGITWPIPLWPSQELSLDILSDTTATIKSPASYIRFNTVGGHYVCHYNDHETRQSIRNDLVNKNLNPSERLLVLNDAMLLSKCAVAPIHQMLDTIEAFKDEEQESIWGVVSLAISDVKMLVEEDAKAEIKLKTFVYELISQKLDQVGWIPEPQESNNDIKLRSILIGMAIYSDNKASLDQALSIYRSAKIEHLDSNLRSAALIAAIKHGTEKDFYYLLEQYPKETVADIKIDIASALCITKKPHQIKDLISKLKNQDFVKLQDVDRFLIYLLRNKVARPHAWDWIVSNWDWIETNFASDKSYDSYPRYAASCFSTEHWLTEYKKHFYPLKKVPALSRNIEIGVKDIENKNNWRNQELKDLKAWLKAR